MTKKIKTISPYIMAICAIIGLTIALYDSIMIYTGQLLWCPPPIDGCNTVAYSPDGRIFGIPIGYFGLIFYLIMLSLAAFLAYDPRSKGLCLAAIVYTAIGVLGSIGFLYLDMFYIKAFCIYCLISGIMTLILFLSAINHTRGMRQSIDKVR
jgi:uncharacterized membrane protein